MPTQVTIDTNQAETEVTITTNDESTNYSISAGARGPEGPNTVTTSTTTNITGIIKGNGTVVSQAISGTDYAAALGANDNYVTDAQLVVIGNTSGSNTGDQFTSVTSHHLLGRHAGGTGAAQEVNVGDGIEFQGSGIRRSALTGDVTASAGSNSTTIANDSVTNAKLANVATATIKGRATASTGDPEDLTPAQARTVAAAAHVAGSNTFGGIQQLAIPGPFATDAEADAAGVPDDNLYYRSTGVVAAATHLSLDLAFALDKTLTARQGPTPTLTRASTATFVGSNGLIQSASINEARFDHNPVTLACKGLLIEEARTNLLLRSEEFSNASWTKLASSVTNSPVASPSGGIAKRILMNSGSSQYPIFGTSYASVANRVVTVSAYARYVNSQWLWVRGDEGLVGGDRWASFNILNGSIGGKLSGITDHQITNVGNGWYRIQLTYTELTTTASSRNIVFRVGNASTPTNSATAQSGTESFDLWGAQVEVGALPTSFIPTTTAALTRSADVCSITGGDFTGMYNATEGTILINASTTASGDRTVLSTDDDTANEMIVLRTEATNPFFKVTDGGSEVVAIDAGTVTANTLFKLAAAYEVNDFAASINGGAVVTDTAGTIPTVDRMRIGAGQAGNVITGHIDRIQYFRKRLPNTKLVTLTT